MADPGRRRLKLAVWSPLPPSPSGIADYVAESLPPLGRHVELQLVVEEPSAVDDELRRHYPVCRPEETTGADLDLYHLGNSPSHAFVYRAALARPGVAFLHEWSLHHLVLRETVERGDVSRYLKEMRRAHGETGTFVGRQVARALGGDVLPALFPLNDRVLEESLAVVALTEDVRARAARRLPGRAVLHLPHHLSLPEGSVVDRAEARRRLGIAPEALVLTAAGLATAAKRLDVAMRVAGRLRKAHPSIQLVVAGESDPGVPLLEWARDAGLGGAFRLTGRLSLPDFVLHLCAADLVLALRFPSHGEISGALIRALGVGRAALVTAGSPASQEFPEGVIVPVDPGAVEETELEALVDHLLRKPALRERMGAVAREYVEHRHRLDDTVATLAAFLERVQAGKDETLAALAADRPRGGMLGFLMEEVRWAARDVGLPAVHLGLESLLGPLIEPPR
jgi:glycosyltransferase involved in cell wall biosynthesis